MDARNTLFFLGFIFTACSSTLGCQYCGCYGAPNCDCYCPPWMYVGYDRIILEPARGQVSVSSSAAASIKYNKGAPQAYISSLSSAKADPKIPVNIIGATTVQPPLPSIGPSVPPSLPPPVTKPTNSPERGSSKPKKTLWDYQASEKAYGPQNWNIIAPQCSGLRQSPVDIVTTIAEPRPASLKLIIPTSDPVATQSLIVKGKLKNNGRSIGFTVDTAASPIKINAYKASFTLRQFHFHFGCEDEMGSEHSLDGQRFPGEIHFVFTNDKFRTAKEAIKVKEGMLSLAFFMQYDENAENKVLTRLSNNIQALRLPHGSIDLSEHGLSLTGLVPALKEGIANLKVFIYQGSLPTPPCFESVTWFVFRRPVKVNPITLENWRNVLQGDYGRLCGNYRPVQKLNGRKIVTLVPKKAADPTQSTNAASGGPTQSDVEEESTEAVPSVSPSVGLRAPPLTLDKVGIGPGRSEKAFATLEGNAGKFPDDKHLPADARQELHPEPLDQNKLNTEGSPKLQTLDVPSQGLNPAFVKVSPAKGNNALPELKKGLETAKQQAFKFINANLLKGGSKQEKKPTVAPGMRRQAGI